MIKLISDWLKCTTCTCESIKSNADLGGSSNHSQGTREPEPVAVGTEVSVCAGRRPASHRHLVLYIASGSDSAYGRRPVPEWVSPEAIIFFPSSATWRGHALSRGFAMALSLATLVQSGKRLRSKGQDSIADFSNHLPEIRRLYIGCLRDRVFCVQFLLIFAGAEMRAPKKVRLDVFLRARCA